MANYAEYIQLPDTSVMYAPILGIDSVKVPVERYVKTADGTPVDSTAVYHTPDGWLVTDNHGKESGLYWQNHPEGKALKVKTLSEEERVQTFNKAFGKDKSKTLADGGILSQAPKELVELVQAAMSDENAAQQLSQLISQRPELKDVVEQIATELQSPQTMKCGGKASKKQLGGKTKKAECGCLIKKVGGRLIEIDGCTGLPVHKTGGVAKFQTPAGVLSEGLSYIVSNPDAHPLERVTKSVNAKKAEGKNYPSGTMVSTPVYVNDLTTPVTLDLNSIIRRIKYNDFGNDTAYVFRPNRTRAFIGIKSPSLAELEQWFNEKYYNK